MPTLKLFDPYLETARLIFSPFFRRNKSFVCMRFTRLRPIETIAWPTYWRDIGEQMFQKSIISQV